LGKFRRLTNIKKSGYAGTLDPFASGVLPIACNKKATRLIENIVSSGKEYVVTAQFGSETDTGDYLGKVVNISANIPSIKDIEQTIAANFLGNITQTPPLYSAVKIGGRRACDLMRSNEENKQIAIQEIQNRSKQILVESFVISNVISSNIIQFTINCGKGTYIRQLIVDLARNLTTFAHATALIRTRVGDFSIHNSLNLDNDNIKSIIDHYESYPNHFITIE
jgi:tRNA pseudouridine55 synthase